MLFLFRLAMDLGLTVGQLKKSITPWELLLWHEFYKRERDEMKRIQEKAKKG